MSAREKGASIEGYREVPSELLERRSYDAPSLGARLAPYGFGITVLAALGVALFFVLTSPVVGVEEEVPIDGEVERLVANAKERMNLTNAAQGSPGGESVVSVSTVPIGALVDIDFQNVGAAPLEYRTRPGVYVVSIRMQEYVSIDSVVVVEASEVKELSFALTPARPGMERDAIDREPPARVEAATAAVELRGGASPASGNPEPAAGDARPSQRDTRPAAGELEFDVRPSTTTPPSTAEIVISSHPAGAEAFLDGRRVGETPVSIRDLKSGPHKIKLVMDGYEPYEMDVRAGAGETATLHGELAQRTGTLGVLVRPWGSIYIDGALHKETTDVKYVTQLPVGEYTVTAVHPDLGTAERTVRIDAGATQEIFINLR